MTTERRRWWRAAAIAAVGGVVVTGGWFGFVRGGQSPRSDGLPPEAANWTRSAAPATPSPTVSEVARTPEPAPVTAPVTPVGATLPPIPLPGGNGSTVVPAIPVTPPVLVPAAPLPVPSLPSAPAVPAVPPAVPSVPAVPTIEPAAGPRLPDSALTGGDKSVLPAVPSVPAVPPADLPVLTAPPKKPETKPSAKPETKPDAPKVPAPSTGAAPVAPGVPSSVGPLAPPMPMTAEPPRAIVPAAPNAPSVVAPASPAAPGPLPLPHPTPLAQSAPSVKPADPMQPMPPVKSNSDLKPTNPGNTLNPTVAPAVPITSGGSGRETPAQPVDRPKPPQPSFDPTDKYVFPVPSGTDPLVTHPRDDTMFKLTTTAAFAVLGGALMAAEKAAALPPVVPPSAIVPKAAVPLKADERDVEKLKTDLAAANKKIEDLEKQIKRLTELLTGKKDELGIVVPSDPGAVEEIKRLKNRIADLSTEVQSLKTQTALKPAIVPDAKPKGVVKVVNEYPVEISMVINDKSYRVAPGSKIDVEVPVGDFTYQLLQSGAASTKSVIKDKETVTLRIK